MPSARATKDITLEQDLIEEIGRIHRYGNIPERRSWARSRRPARRGLEPAHARARAPGSPRRAPARFHETLSYSFVSDALVGTLGLTDQRFVAVVNPVAEGLSKIRRARAAEPARQARS